MCARILRNDVSGLKSGSNTYGQKLRLKGQSSPSVAVILSGVCGAKDLREAMDLFL
jgi:hypothetical protein